MALPLALTGNVGDTIVIKSNQMDAYGQTSSSTVVWSTSDATVANATAVYDKPGYGLITCVAAGNATITATADLVNTTILLTVVAPAVNAPAAAITVETVTLPPNKTMQTKTYPKV